MPLEISLCATIGKVARTLGSSGERPLLTPCSRLNSAQESQGLWIKERTAVNGHCARSGKVKG